MQSEQSRLGGRVAVVTGATSGIGRAIANALVRNGCKVAAVGRNVERLQELRDSLGELVHPLALDLADASGIADLPGRIPAGWGEPTILVNNAGEDVGGRTRFDECDADELTRVIEINLQAVIRLTRVIVPGMLKQDRGDIVNIGSTQALRPTQNMAAYTASKAGLHALTDVLRADYSKVGIRVIEIMPGLTRTEFAKTRWRGDEERARAYFEKFASSLSPDDVADAVEFAVTRAPHVSTSQIVITPSWQW